jgi:hypothetical protein
MSTSASLREKVDLSQVEARRSTSARRTTASQEKFANIEANPFYSTLMNPEATPQQRKADLVKLRTYEGTKAENKQRAQEYDLFKEYLQDQREQMAKAIIELTDTETFAELQSTYKDINEALIKFEEDMTPLTDIIDAVYALRTSGKAGEAFKEIRSDRERQAEIDAGRVKADQTLADAKASYNRLSAELATVKNSSSSKKFFGLGGYTDAATAEIARLQVLLDDALVSVSDAETARDHAYSMTTSGSSTLVGSNDDETAKLQAAKAKLEEMLNLSSEQHTERQKSLISSALRFIETSKDRIGSIRSHMSEMDSQTDNLGNVNQRMSEIYAVMTEAEKEAAAVNQAKREELARAEEGEDTIARLNRETTLRDVDEHIKNVAQSTVDTQATYADLASQAVRIMTMKDAITTQQTKAREMHSRGVAGIADRLSTVLQAVSGAAIAEAQQLAQATHRSMMESTNRIAQKESIRVAMGIDETNEDLDRLMADLESYGEVSKASTDIVRAGLAEMNEKLETIAQIRDDVIQATNEAAAVASDVSPRGHTGKVTKGKAPGFDLGLSRNAS